AHNFIIEYLFIGHMIRCRYWHLSIDELKKVTYDPKKVLVWEIKCSKDEAAHFGVFFYRNGTPWDYASIHGIVFYYNMISRDEVNRIAEFLKGKFGGEIKEKGERVFWRTLVRFTPQKRLLTLQQSLATSLRQAPRFQLSLRTLARRNRNKVIFLQANSCQFRASR
ncbi:MAG TPA: hypothetical protein VJJ01_01605, partial [Nitrosopumilaceae archaeon]|nr:hypothetical protein [Nitrosopumilaceae archaeon]